MIPLQKRIKRVKNEHKKSEMTFYSARGIMLMIAAVLIFATIAVIGMYRLGVISIPDFISDVFDKTTDVSALPPSANIASHGEETERFEALPRDEYAAALADITTPSEFYYNYNLTWFSGDSSRTVNYTAIGKNGSWWVQTKENDVIMSTAVCRDGIFQFSDNADNSFAETSGEGISFSEYAGFMPLEQLTALIYALTSGDSVEYGGGVSDYSLSYTLARGTNENLFNFNFTRGDGVSEKYTFALESATILSISKFNSDGEKIYQMEMKDARNNLDEINVDSLLVLKNND